MAYSYLSMRPYVFTEDGISDVLLMRDRARDAMKDCGSIKIGKLIETRGLHGDSWQRLAVIDYLIERGYVRPLSDRNGGTATQNIVLVEN